MPRGKANRSLNVGKKIEIVEEAESTGLYAVTAKKYGIKAGQIRDWKKNLPRLRSTDPDRLVAASTIERGHLIFNESYAQYWAGYNKYATQFSDKDSFQDMMRVTWKDVGRDNINTISYPSEVDLSATFDLDFPNSGFMDEESRRKIQEDLRNNRTKMQAFFDKKIMKPKNMYFLTRFDFVSPNATLATSSTDQDPEVQITIDNYISAYAAFNGSGECLVPFIVFPPPEPQHWERKKKIRLRHGYSMHRVKENDPEEALQFFKQSWKKFYEEEAGCSDRFVILLDESVEEFTTPHFTNGLSEMTGFGKDWCTLSTVQNPLTTSHFHDIMQEFILDEWRKVLSMKKSQQPNDYRRCVAFWFHEVWDVFAGEYARAAFRSCNMFLEEKKDWQNPNSLDCDDSESHQISSIAQQESIATTAVSHEDVKTSSETSSIII